MKLSLHRLLILSCLLCSVSGMAAEMRGSVSLQGRYFYSDPVEKRQFGKYTSLALSPEFYFSNDQGDHSLTFSPFYRMDSHDEERSHGDIRELYWLFLGNSVEVSAGIRKIFWGTTESQHLVDVINQTDLVENMDTEDKLGQPMLSATLLANMGVFDFYLMPYFRERTFPAADGRPQFFPSSLFNSEPLYESSVEEKHLDWAVRWSQTFGYWDIGLSQFYGTNREPLFIPDSTESGILQIRPYYELMHQTGVDIQGAVGAWLWKLEAIHRNTSNDNFNALTAGFEYTWFQLKSSSLDVGLVVEYLYDNRILETTAFNDDVMMGLRLSPNDVQSSDFLLGLIWDRENQSQIYRLEAGRRLTDHLRLDIEASVFSGLNSNNIFFNLRDDDFIQAELTWSF